MRKLNKTEIKSLGNMSIADKENLLPKHVIQRVRKMPAHKKALKIINMSCQKRDNVFGVKGGEQAHNKAWNIWHRLYETAIKRTPKLFIEKADANKVARKKYTAEDIKLFRNYLYNNEVDMWCDEGYGQTGGEEKAEPWLTVSRRIILDEMFFISDGPEGRAQLLESLKENNE
jgi:hypothetical protein